MDKKLKNNCFAYDLNENNDKKIINSELNDGNCVSANQFRQNVFQPKLCNRDKAIRKANDLINTLDMNQLTKVMGEFNQYLSNDSYLVNKSVFRDDMLPRLQTVICGKDERQKFYALCLLLKLLFDESLSKKSKLAKVAVKASIVSTLMQISLQNNSDSSSQKAIHALLSYLFFVIAYNGKQRAIKKLILSDTEIILKSVMRAQTENSGIYVDTICLLQFFPLWSKNYETLEPMLTTLKTLIASKDNKVIIESYYALMVFARNYGKARAAIVRDKNLCKKLVELLQMCDNSAAHPQEDTATPIVAILSVILPNHNTYRKAFVENGLLNGVKNLLNCCHCYRRYGCDIIKWLCMTPLCDRLNQPIEIIDRVLDCGVMPLINQVIENDSNMTVKYSALYAVFTLTYNASYDQMLALSNQGTLESLCAQITSADNKFVHLVLVTITNLLDCDFMEQLRNQKFPYPVENLSTFAEIIKANDGINLLKLITKRENIDGVKEISKNKVFAEDLLAYGLGDEIRAPKRKPTANMMDEQKGRKDCINCNSKVADTLLFQCEHNVLCKPCASKLLYKILNGDKPNECPESECKKEVKLTAAPFGVIRNRKHIINKDIEREVCGEFVNECEPIKKANVTICAIN